MKTKLWEGLWRGKVPAGDEHHRARKIVRPTGGIVRGKFPSRKNGRMVHHEGLLELDAIYLFEASPRIAGYREQPSTIRYPDGAKLRRYTPDFELQLSTGEIVLVEIKPMRSLEDEEVRHRLDCVAAYLKRTGVSFVVLTDEHIRLEPQLSNVRLVYHSAARVAPTVEAGDVALRRYRQYFPLSIASARELLGKCGVDPYSLLLTGHLSCALDQQISINSPINLVEEADHDWFWISREYGF